MLYKFKVELSAWAAKVALSVFTTWALTLVLSVRVGHTYAVELRWLADREWIIRCVFLLAVGLIWACYFKTVRIFRRGYRQEGN